MKKTILLGLGILTLFSCKKEVEVLDLVGVWESSESSLSYTSSSFTFREDGTFSVNGDTTEMPYELSGVDLSLHYTSLGGDTLYTNYYEILKLKTNTMKLGIVGEPGGKVGSKRELVRLE